GKELGKGKFVKEHPPFALFTLSLQKKAAKRTWRTKILSMLFVEKVSVDLNKFLLFFRDFFFGINGFNRANSFTGTSVNAHIGIDIKHIISLNDTVHGTGFHTFA